MDTSRYELWYIPGEIRNSHFHRSQSEMTVFVPERASGGLWRNQCENILSSKTMQTLVIGVFNGNVRSWGIDGDLRVKMNRGVSVL
jgi:hypothetical protein